MKTLISMATESPHWLIMGKMMAPPFSVVLNPIPFILAGNEDMQQISDKFEFRPDWTTDYGVMSKKFSIHLLWENSVSMLAHSFLIASSWKLLVTRTGIKARTSLISGVWFPWPIYMFFEMRGCQVRLHQFQIGYCTRKCQKKKGVRVVIPPAFMPRGI